MSDVFGAGEGTQEQQDPTPSALDQLVGEGRKFKTTEDLARGKVEADSFITKLQEEAAELRAKLEEQEELKARLEALTKAQQAPTEPKQTAQPSATGPVDVDSINQLVEQAIAQREAASVETANIQRSNDAVVAAHGGDLQAAQKFIQEKAVELGLTTDKMVEMARTSPAAFLRLVGVQEGQQQAVKQQQAPKGTPYTPTGQAETGTWAYFENIRKTNPRAYYSAEVQNELMRAAHANPNFLGGSK